MQPFLPPTFKLGLIGYPLSHSLSPNIHTAALRACGFEGDYSLFPIYPEDKNGLQDLLSRVRSGETHGLNVTIPHKQNVISFLDKLTPTAEAIGAVNTIYLREGELIGDNTDAAGFLTDLKNFLATAAQRNEANRALIVGAGGSARAVVYALLNDGWDVILTARRIEQAQHLAHSIANTKSPGVVSSFTDVEFSKIALLVNTTPVGMTPNIDQSPLPENLSLPRHVSMYDLVYNPRETKLVKEARAQGLNATTGLGMLIEQAALSFELWTGHKPLREIMRASVEGSPVSN